MNLVWKLLRHHISIAQMAGFFLANVFGLFVVLLGFQFYLDVISFITSDDGFLKDDYVVVNHKIGASNLVSGKNTGFTQSEIDDIQEQTFAKTVGIFTSNEYHVRAEMSIKGSSLLNSEVFFESIPDEFVDIDQKEWHYSAGERVVPILLPRSYLTMYNFGFSKLYYLPTVSDGVVSMIDLKFLVQGNSRNEMFIGKIVGFSSKISSILVPRSFMDWSNSVFSTHVASLPARLLIKVENPANEEMLEYMDNMSYEIDSDRMDTGKETYLLKLIVLAVMMIGVLISFLSIYILILSIYLLVQKNSTKLETLMIIGFTVRQVAFPYQMLAAVLNLVVLLLAVSAVFVLRSYYIDIVQFLYPSVDVGSAIPMISLGIILLFGICVVNYCVIYNRIKRIWYSKRKK